MSELCEQYRAGDMVDGRRVAWVPQPRQAMFMSRFEDEALFGGAAGGGKSDALVAEALRQIDKPYYKGLILRKSYPQLLELIDKAYRLYPMIDPRAKYNESKHTWTFSSGAKVIFGSLNAPKDKYKYQGIAYDFVGFDELTHFRFEEYEYLISRNRPNGPGMLCYVRATANPGGIGHGWVKERFVTVSPPMTTTWHDVEVLNPDGTKTVHRRSRIFVPSRVQDNPALMRYDPSYVARLASMSEAECRALLYGDWDAYTGQVFSEWKNDPDHYIDRKYTHVIAPFDVPDYWRIYRSLDWGIRKPFSIGWWAIDQEGVAYRIKEWYGCEAYKPDVGLGLAASDVFAEVARVEREDPLFRGKHIYGVADPAIWGSQTGESVAEIAERYKVYFEKGDNSRVAGWAQVHERLKFGPDGRPRLYVFNTCRDFIRTFPALIYDEHKVEDVDTTQEDHCLVGDTQVLTDEGYRPLKSLVGTEGRVMSHDGTYHKYFDVRLTRKNADILVLELEDGTQIYCTDDHRFMLLDGEWIRAGDLMAGMEVKTHGSTSNQQDDPEI